MLADINTAPSTVQKVKQMIASATDGFPSQEDVAERLHLSRNTLKRRLLKDGTSFNDIVQQYKQQQAVKLFCGTNMSLHLQSIAEKLDYADQTNFGHVFKRWTGHSSACYRRQQ